MRNGIDRRRNECFYNATIPLRHLLDLSSDDGGSVRFCSVRFGVMSDATKVVSETSNLAGNYGTLAELRQTKTFKNMLHATQSRHNYEKLKKNCK